MLAMFISKNTFLNFEIHRSIFFLTVNCVQMVTFWSLDVHFVLMEKMERERFWIEFYLFWIMGIKRGEEMWDVFFFPSWQFLLVVKVVVWEEKCELASKLTFKLQTMKGWSCYNSRLSRYQKIRWISPWLLA